MEAVKYITNAQGKRDSIMIDLNSLRKKVKKRKALTELLEDIEDVIAVELSVNEPGVPYEKARKELLKKKMR